MRKSASINAIVSLLLASAVAVAEPPSASFLFPAGGQRGKSVAVRVGGHYLHDRAAWEILGTGVTADPELVQTNRVWFEGPLLRLPASQRSEDYPRDYLSRIQIAKEAPIGPRYWRAWNAQGVTPALRFVVGDLPEMVEEEIDGEPMSVTVQLPVTINGRIFPREEIDRWSFDVKAGESITAFVAAADVGSPLEARLELRDANGRLLAESNETPRGDPLLRFQAMEAGRYEIRIIDSRFGGAPNYVYRLTLTNGPWIDRIYPLGGKRGAAASLEAAGQAIPKGKIEANLPDLPPGIVRHTFAIGGVSTNEVLLDLDDVTEHREPATGPKPQLAAPTVGNGIIALPGEVDAWPFAASKGTSLKLEIRAARLGSPLDGMLVIRDSLGKELAKAEDLPDGSADCELEFTPPADGTYLAEVSERFASRGGPAFAYRLRVTQPAADFRLTLGVDSLPIDVGGSKKLPVQLQRLGPFKEPVKVKLEGLPSGIQGDDITIAANQTRGELTIQVDKSSPVRFAKPAVIGRAEIAGAMTERRATVSLPGQPNVIPPPLGMAALDHVVLAATLATPFRFRGEYEFRYIPRGGPLKKTYQIERNGYVGALEVTLADRQGRHLQGITGPVVSVPAGATEFTYSVRLAPWMELGRTSRTNLMITGELSDAAGKKHKVCFVTNDQNEQLIALVSPAPLRITPERASIVAAANAKITVPVRIQRDRSLVGPVRIEVILPSHLKDVTAAPVIAPADATSAEIVLTTGTQPGPFNAPLILRGASEHQGEPLVAEATFLLLTPAP